MDKKVLLAVPSGSGYLPALMVQSLLQLHKPCPCAFAVVERQRTDKCRDFFAKETLKQGFDYLLIDRIHSDLSGIPYYNITNDNIVTGTFMKMFSLGRIEIEARIKDVTDENFHNFLNSVINQKDVIFTEETNVLPSDKYNIDKNFTLQQGFIDLNRLQTVKDIILESLEATEECLLSNHSPNKETQKSLKNIEAGKDLIERDSLEAFAKKLGL